MLTYEVKLKKIGEMTTLPDSQRLFGFLINSSKRYCSEDKISMFARDVRKQEQKCMISSLVPSGYYPTPKEYILQKLHRRLEMNQEKIKELEEEQLKVKKESEIIIQKLIEKNSQKNDKESKLSKEDKKELDKEIRKLKSQLEQKKGKFNELADSINDLSTKYIYETLKNMDFVSQDYLKELLKLAKAKSKIDVEDLKKFKYVKKNQTFIQKFRLESQMKELPGIPNVTYSLPILSFTNQQGEIQKEFSFFVSVEQETCISMALDGMEKEIGVHGIPCFLGGKGSAGYNEYRICSIEKTDEKQDKNQPVENVVYLNLGVLLPNFDVIDAENSVLELYTSDRKPFEIENEIPKVISFVTAGSVIKVNEGEIGPYKVGKSIDNSKYNPLYQKNAIIFGNSYLVSLEVYNET